MSERFLDAFVLGAWQANCYVLGDLARGTCVVVDPGQGGREPILGCLAERGVTCEAILLTHGHLDHLWTAPDLAAALDVPVLLHPDDHYLWRDPAAAFGTLPPGALQQQFGLVWEPDATRLEAVREGQALVLGGQRLVVRHTPGHTPGSSVFLGEDLLLSGDLVFAGSIGRTDFPRGDHAAELASIARVVLPLDDDVVIHSGHGPATTVGRERRTNPFLRGLA